MRSLRHKTRLLKLANYLAGPVARADDRVKKLEGGGGKFHMDYYANAKKIGVEPNLCHTSGCALGYATVLFPKSLRIIQTVPGTFVVQPIRSHFSVSRFAGEFFGLKMDEVDEAFYSGYDRTPREEAAILRRLAAS